MPQEISCENFESGTIDLLDFKASKISYAYRLLSRVVTGVDLYMES